MPSPPGGAGWSEGVGAMPHINVVIAGKTYRMACGDGEETHLAALATGFDARVAEMRRTFGEIGDMRLHVMAAITVEDELSELRRRLAHLEEEAVELRRAATAATDAETRRAARVAGAVAEAATRIERLAAMLAGTQAPAVNSVG